MARKPKSVSVPQRSFETREEFQLFIENEREWMYSRIFEAIEQAFRSNQTEANVFEARIEESMSIVVMKSEIADWETSLNLALKWYEKKEMYEVCAKIYKLIQEIRTVLEAR